MTIGRMVAIFVGCLVIGVIAGLVTRNFIVAIAFPFLLVAFLLMWRNLKENPPKDLEKQEPVQDDTVPQEETQVPPAESQAQNQAESVPQNPVNQV